MEAHRDAPLRVLLADDYPDATESLAVVLRLWGHDPVEVHDGPAALAAAAALQPDVVLLDLRMPGLDGYEVARRLRRLPGLESALLIALTGFGRQSDVARARAAGFDHHLLKPPDLDTLGALLRARAAHGGASRSPVAVA